ncbi:MAG TPA: class I SAM-dependent methyltransferase [Kiritimatiellia bacterium]|nr:class I SAM-dependent methyltransferase [Kiritimatiellia bacterium]HNS81534.1 class I SAM-dependent methyltransferase [Kiritimatiellia bacterium]
MSDQGAEGILSAWLRRHRLAATRPHLRGTVLDIGCGAGALADEYPAEHYVGVDIDEESLAVARHHHPEHQFCAAADPELRVNTIALLAAIEHVADPAGFLRGLANHLLPGGHFVLTTPAPWTDRVHAWGAAMGLFSHAAHEEHEKLIDPPYMRAISHSAGLRVTYMRRFLFGANQLFILDRDPTKERSTL